MWADSEGVAVLANGDRLVSFERQHRPRSALDGSLARRRVVVLALGVLPGTVHRAIIPATRTNTTAATTPTMRSESHGGATFGT